MTGETFDKNKSHYSKIPSSQKNKGSEVKEPHQYGHIPLKKDIEAQETQTGEKDYDVMPPLDKAFPQEFHNEPNQTKEAVLNQPEEDEHYKEVPLSKMKEESVEAQYEVMPQELSQTEQSEEQTITPEALSQDYDVPNISISMKLLSIKDFLIEQNENPDFFEFLKNAEGQEHRIVQTKEFFNHIGQEKTKQFIELLKSNDARAFDRFISEQQEITQFLELTMPDGSIVMDEIMKEYVFWQQYADVHIPHVIPEEDDQTIMRVLSQVIHQEQHPDKIKKAKEEINSIIHLYQGYEKQLTSAEVTLLNQVSKKDVSEKLKEVEKNRKIVARILANVNGLKHIFEQREHLSELENNISKLKKATNTLSESIQNHSIVMDAIYQAAMKKNIDNIGEAKRISNNAQIEHMQIKYFVQLWQSMNLEIVEMKVAIEGKTLSTEDQQRVDCALQQAEFVKNTVLKKYEDAFGKEDRQQYFYNDITKEFAALFTIRHELEKRFEQLNTIEEKMSAKQYDEVSTLFANQFKSIQNLEASLYWHTSHLNTLSELGLFNEFLLDGSLQSRDFITDIDKRYEDIKQDIHSANYNNLISRSQNSFDFVKQAKTIEEKSQLVGSLQQYCGFLNDQVSRMVRARDEVANHYLENHIKNQIFSIASDIEQLDFDSINELLLAYHDCARKIYNSSAAAKVALIEKMKQQFIALSELKERLQLIVKRFDDLKTFQETEALFHSVGVEVSLNVFMERYELTIKQLKRIEYFTDNIPEKMDNVADIYQKAALQLTHESPKYLSESNLKNILTKQSNFINKSLTFPNDEDRQALLIESKHLLIDLNTFIAKNMNNLQGRTVLFEEQEKALGHLNNVLLKHRDLLFRIRKSNHYKISESTQELVNFYQQKARNELHEKNLPQDERLVTFFSLLQFARLVQQELEVKIGLENNVRIPDLNQIDKPECLTEEILDSYIEDKKNAIQDEIKEEASQFDRIHERREREDFEDPYKPIQRIPSQEDMPHTEHYTELEEKKPLKSIPSVKKIVSDAIDKQPTPTLRKQRSLTMNSVENEIKTDIQHVASKVTGLKKRRASLSGSSRDEIKKTSKQLLIDQKNVQTFGKKLKKYQDKVENIEDTLSIETMSKEDLQKQKDQLKKVQSKLEEFEKKITHYHQEYSDELNILRERSSKLFYILGDHLQVMRMRTPNNAKMINKAHTLERKAAALSEGVWFHQFRERQLRQEVTDYQKYVVTQEKLMNQYEKDLQAMEFRLQGSDMIQNLMNRIKQKQDDIQFTMKTISDVKGLVLPVKQQLFPQRERSEDSFEFIRDHCEDSTPLLQEKSIFKEKIYSTQPGVFSISEASSTLENEQVDIDESKKYHSEVIHPVQPKLQYKLDGEYQLSNHTHYQKVGTRLSTTIEPVESSRIDSDDKFILVSKMVEHAIKIGVKKPVLEGDAEMVRIAYGLFKAKGIHVKIMHSDFKKPEGWNNKSKTYKQVISEKKHLKEEINDVIVQYNIQPSSQPELSSSGS